MGIALRIFLPCSHRQPGRRFATFKIFYTDDTPLDYEPPYFQAGDMEKDKCYFMTHDFDEVPDRYNIGKLDTGHHWYVLIKNYDKRSSGVFSAYISLSLLLHLTYRHRPSTIMRHLEGPLHKQAE